jgi:hypothetical protein
MRFRNFQLLLGGALALLISAGTPALAGNDALITNGYLDPQELQLVGTAKQTAAVVSLTGTDNTAAAGAMFLTQRITTRSFRADFKFRVIPGAPGGETSSDGFTFTIAASPAALGSAYGGLGYAGIKPGGFSIEFDTWNNGPALNDPDGNHLGLNLNGSTLSVRTVPLPIRIDDGLLHTAIVTYEATVQGGHVTVSVDGQLFLDVTDQQIGVPDGYFGFTASTGEGTAEHRIESFRLLTAIPGSTAKSKVRANNATLGSTTSVKAKLKGTVSTNRRAVPKGRIRLTFVTRPRVRWDIRPDAIVVQPDGSATIYGRVQSGFLVQLVRLDVMDLRTLDPVRFLRDDGAPSDRWQLVKGKLRVKVPRVIEP